MAPDSNKEALNRGGAAEDDCLADLFAEYVERLERGEELDREHIRTAHADLAPELLEELDAFQSLGSELQPEKVLGTLGDYTLRRQLGRGGMGVVYEAWQGSMDRVVALKVLPSGVAADDQAFNRFMREAKTAGKLDHQHIVSVHAAGFDENTPYYAMEYVDGETLAQLLRRLKETEPESETPFGPKDQVDWFAKLARAFAEVADGLQHAHSKGVIHRDIKPSNLILDGEGRLRILDFGLARLEGQDSLTISGDVVGTPAYMSPEQARRRKIPVDHRTDIYSFGATLYELITQQQPFRGKDHADTLSRIIERDPRPPRQLNPRVPAELETIVLKCLRKDAGDRYGTAEALGQDLRRFVRSDPIEARPQTRWETTLRLLWQRRRRLGVGSALVLLFSITLLLALKSYDTLRFQKEQAYTEKIHRAVLKAQLTGLTFQNDSAGFFGRNTWQRLGPGDFEAFVDQADTAAADLADAAREFPGKPEADYHRARVLEFLDRKDEALLALERALRRDPDFVPALVFRASLRQSRHEQDVPLDPGWSSRHPDWAAAWLTAFGAMRQGKWQKAERAYDTLLAFEEEGQSYLGSFIEARLGRALARLQQQDPRAIEDFAQVRARWPGALEPTLFLARAYHVLGHDETAERVFADLHARAERKQDACLWVANAYWTLGDDEKYAEWIERLEPGSVKERLRSRALKRLGRTDAALAAADKAIALDPSDPKCYEAKAEVLEELGRFADAASCIEEALLRHPEVTTLWYWKGFFAFRRGKYLEGVKACQRSIDLDPNFAAAHTWLGSCLFALGRISEALTQVDVARRLEPREQSHLLILGWMHLCLGRLDEAEAALKAATGLSRRMEASRRFLALALERQGKVEEALRYLKEACALYPRRHQPHYRHGLLLERHGDTQGALHAYVNAFELRPRSRSTHYRICQLLARAPHDAELLDDVRRLSDVAESVTDAHPRALHLLALARLWRGERYLEGTAQLLDLALEKLKRPDPDILGTRAQLAALQGDHAGAVRLLEDALRLPYAGSYLAQRLDTLRMVVKEAIPSFASVDAILETTLRASFAAPRELRDLRGRDKDVQTYLEGRLLQLAGKHGEAVTRFSDAAGHGGTGPEPLLRLAENLEALAKPEEAERELRHALERWPENRELWYAWVFLSLERLRATPAETLARLPALDGESKVAADLRWLLEELDAGRTLRINCGGRKFADGDGNVWSVDRFYNGGSIYSSFEQERFQGSRWRHAPKLEGENGFRGDIDATEDDALYQTERWFLREEYRPAYRIPLPQGRYAVTLHFAESWYRAAGQRSFDVTLEGDVVLSKFEPFAGGFATAFKKELPARIVSDGALDLGFVPREGYPKVSAIEVRRVD